jgi:hypothetical protein
MKQSPSSEGNPFSAGQEIHRILWNLKIITTITRARQLYLPWARSIHSMPPHPTSWRSILILSYHLRLGFPSGFFPSAPPHMLYTPVLSTIRATCPVHFILLHSITRIWFGDVYRSLSSLLRSCLVKSGMLLDTWVWGRERWISGEAKRQIIWPLCSWILQWCIPGVLRADIPNVTLYDTGILRDKNIIRKLIWCFLPERGVLLLKSPKTRKYICLNL